MRLQLEVVAIVHSYEKLCKIQIFRKLLSDTEKAAWNAFKSLCTTRLRNHKVEHFEDVIIEMVKLVPSYEVEYIPKVKFFKFSS